MVCANANLMKKQTNHIDVSEFLSGCPSCLLVPKSLPVCVSLFWLFEIAPFSISLSVSVPVCLPVCHSLPRIYEIAPVRLSVCLSVSLSIFACLFVCLSLSAYLSQSVCLSVFLWLACLKLRLSCLPLLTDSRQNLIDGPKASLHSVNLHLLQLFLLFHLLLFRLLLPLVRMPRRRQSSDLFSTVK